MQVSSCVYDVQTLCFTKFNKHWGLENPQSERQHVKILVDFQPVKKCSSFLSFLSSLCSILILWLLCCNFMKQCSGCGFGLFNE